MSTNDGTDHGGQRVQLFLSGIAKTHHQNFANLFDGQAHNEESRVHEHAASAHERRTNIVRRPVKRDERFASDKSVKNYVETVPDVGESFANSGACRRTVSVRSV